MTIVIVLLGVVLLAVSALIIAQPAKCLDYLRSVVHKKWLHLFAIAVRLLLGTALILLAADSRFPVAVEIIGWVAVVAAIGLAAIGQQKFIQLVGWTISRLADYARAGGLIALLLAGFLIAAFV